MNWGLRCNYLLTLTQADFEDDFEDEILQERIFASDDGNTTGWDKQTKHSQDK